jgi:hypothetical protein
MGRTLILGLLALGCAPKAPPSSAQLAEELGFGTTPRLHSATSAAYVVVGTVSRDPVIGPLTRGRTADAALSGAASGLALALAEESGGMARWELREALWRAGWAHPVYDARGWSALASMPPPPEVFAWLDGLAEDEPFGLARARGRNADAWVGVRARDPVDLGALPRVAAVGTPLVLPPVAGATWRAADGRGEVREGALDAGATLLLATAGEWIVEVRQDRKELARFPVYVGMEPPTTPLLRLPEAVGEVTGSEDARARALALLEHVRRVYDAAPWKPSPVLDLAVSRYLQDPDAGSAKALADLGFPAARGVVWACDDTTVENCVDGWVWDVRRRAALVGAAYDSLGLVATVDRDGVHLTALLAGTER